ncbi:MAG: metallophosphoesterase [Cyclobacteriaceae bacterium]|nr:metallophosphoesterase [Cyclobacteriaceae bacterium]
MKLLVLLLFATHLSIAQPIRGTVYHDKNNNGIRDKGEEGIANVAVTDQVEVVLTNKEGFYEFAVAKGYGFVAVSLPEGYSARLWWQRVSTTNDFGLTKAVAKTTYSFIHASDTHLSEKSVDRMEKLRALASQHKVDFVLVTGDLVKDALRVSEKEAAAYYDLYRREIEKFAVPVWSVPGNHEIFGIERHLSLVSKSNPLYGKKMYHHYLGPNYFSFNIAGFHFIGLDNVDYEDLWYFGRVDSTQVKWLKEDLSNVPATVPVITFGHMPFYSGGLSMTHFTEEGPSRTLEREGGKLQFRHVVSNADEVIALVATHPYPIALAGHYHARQIFWYETSKQKIRFEQTGAVVEANKHGNEILPSGVTLYTIANGKIGEGKFLPLDE